MGIKFSVKLSVNKKFVFNGKEYNSIEDLPEEVRSAYKAQLSGAQPEHVSNGPSLESKAAEVQKEEGLAGQEACQAIEPSSGSNKLLWAVIFVVAAIVALLVYNFLHRPIAP